ncbi:unnamed protein product [Enterobius vermicularis]|uniref:Uncharacterized protein n=1 Tax=Enterobius vermicularis TaxID=51028 RepID=A0A0N4UWX8_ENTVE|nr:unnamed protein product [Enterobius vermicularis]
MHIYNRTLLRTKSVRSEAAESSSTTSGFDYAEGYLAVLNYSAWNVREMGGAPYLPTAAAALYRGLGIDWKGEGGGEGGEARVREEFSRKKLANLILANRKS